MTLTRKDFLLTNEQIAFLESLEGNMSEHIRRALDEYIVKKRSLNVSSSASKLQKGALYGQPANEPSPTASR